MKLFPHISSTLLLALASVLIALVVASDDATFSRNLEKEETSDSENTHGVRMLSNSNRPCRTINANNGNGKNNKNGKDKPCTNEEKTRRRPAKYIVGGTPVDSDSNYREAIGLVQVARTDSSGNPTSVYPEPFCSGTLIASRFVLTAAHCVKDRRSTTTPDEVAIYFGRDVDDDLESGDYWKKLAVVEAVLPHPSYRSNRFSNDIALMRLRDERPETPVPVLPSTMGLKSPQDIGRELFFVGFGIGGENGDTTVKKQYIGGIELSSFTSDPGIRYSQGDGGPCSGDSGGGTYVSEGGTMYNSGVVSYGDSSCTSYGVSTQSDRFYEWISEFVGIQTPPTSPTNPPPTNPPPTNPSPTNSAPTIPAPPIQLLPIHLRLTPLLITSLSPNAEAAGDQSHLAQSAGAAVSAAPAPVPRPETISSALALRYRNIQIYMSNIHCWKYEIF